MSCSSHVGFSSTHPQFSQQHNNLPFAAGYAITASTQFNTLFSDAILMETYVWNEMVSSGSLDSFSHLRRIPFFSPHTGCQFSSSSRQLQQKITVNAKRRQDDSYYQDYVPSRPRRMKRYADCFDVQSKQELVFFSSRRITISTEQQIRIQRP